VGEQNRYLAEKKMRNTKFACCLALLCTVLVNHAFAAKKIIRAARMIDVSTGELISPAAIVVAGNRIVRRQSGDIADRGRDHRPW